MHLKYLVFESTFLRIRLGLDLAFFYYSYFFNNNALIIYNLLFKLFFLKKFTWCSKYKKVINGL